MRKLFYFFFIASVAITSCKPATESGSTSTNTTSGESNKETKGKFTVDGKEYTGDVDIQKFGAAGKENFSVLCQWDGEGSAFALLQITFVTEKEAKTAGTVRVNNGAILAMTDPEPGVAAVVVSGQSEKFGDEQYYGTDKTGSSIKVDEGKLTLDNAKLFNSEGKEIMLSAVLNY